MIPSTLTTSIALQLQIPSFLQQTIANIIAFIPRLIAAIVILIIFWIIGRIVAGVIRRIIDAVELDRLVLNTPLGSILGGSEQAVASTLGKFAAYYIYFIGVLTAANALAIPVLSRFLAQAVSYIPALIAGLVVILIGFIVADFIADAITRSRSAQQTAYTGVIATGVRLFTYYIAITIGLNTMGIGTNLLQIIGQGFAYGIGAAIAIGIGGAIALGGQDFVRENINDWTGTGSGGDSTSSSARSRGGSSGSSGDAERTDD